MSRIGVLPVAIPDKVKVNLDGSTVSVEGPKGKLSRSFDNSITIKQENGNIVVKPADNSRHSRAMWGTVRSTINGMVQGVVEPFTKNLEIQGVGFRATVQGNIVDLALGFSHEIKVPIPAGVTVETDKPGTKISVTGCDKHAVGQLAAVMKSYYPVEPYKGKGVRIVGEYVRRKEGKKTK